jgi:hypothetical protein
MSQTRERLTTALLVAGVLGLAAGCTSDDQVSAAPAATDVAPTPGATASPTPVEAASPEQALVAEYLDAAAAGDAAAAWQLLTPQAQQFYSTEQTFAGLFGRDGTVSADEAGQLLAGEMVSSEGPEGAFTLVSVTTDSEADAWVVRAVDGDPADLRIDDAGVPPTGGSLYELRNPAAGAEDARYEAGPAALDASQPATLSFASPASMDSDVPSTVGYPDALFGWVDGTSVPVELGAAAGSERQFTADVEPGEGAPTAFTVVWETGLDGGAPASWRSSTVLL